MQSDNYQEIVERVKWWLTDMVFKPPEVLTEWYYECMAHDIAETATGVALNWVGATPCASNRLDPPS